MYASTAEFPDHIESDHLCRHPIMSVRLRFLFHPSANVKLLWSWTTERSSELDHRKRPRVREDDGVIELETESSVNRSVPTSSTNEMLWFTTMDDPVFSHRLISDSNRFRLKLDFGKSTAKFIVHHKWGNYDDNHQISRETCIIMIGTTGTSTTTTSATTPSKAECLKVYDDY